MVQKRTLHTHELKTIGFNPEEPIDVTTWHILNLPKKVEYIDAEHEFFKTPERFQEQIEASLDSTRKEHPAKKDDSLKKVIFNKFNIIKDPSNSSSLQIAR